MKSVPKTMIFLLYWNSPTVGLMPYFVTNSRNQFISKILRGEFVTVKLFFYMYLFDSIRQISHRIVQV